MIIVVDVARLTLLVSARVATIRDSLVAQLSLVAMASLNFCAEWYVDCFCLSDIGG